MTLNCTTYTATTDTQRHAIDDDGPYQFVYGDWRSAYARPIAKRGGRVYERTHDDEPLPHVIDGNVISFPAFKGCAPILKRVGSREVTSCWMFEDRKGVEWRCDCGKTGRMQISHWRRADSASCVFCTRRKTSNALPGDTVRQQIARDVAKAKANPYGVKVMPHPAWIDKAGRRRTA